MGQLPGDDQTNNQSHQQWSTAMNASDSSRTETNATNNTDTSLHIHSTIKAGGWGNHNEEMAHAHHSADSVEGSDTAMRLHTGVKAGGWGNHNEALRRTGR
jgi:hypothetical protein